MPSTLHVFALFALNALYARAQIPLYKSFAGKQFTEGFFFFTDRDPANGVVNYVSETTAEAQNLVSWSESIQLDAIPLY
ncbi:hypothetical protein CPB86DRAFT_695191 [Serendipita vermifera]|nr:hypothetical protein CPB86DRAFT_695191 [Serendipita vermifera]